MSHKRILVGQKWVDEIDRELKSADHFVVLLSADSIRSDMLRQEVADAHRLARMGRTRVYPIRVAFDGALPYDLGSYLTPLQYLLWNTGDSWDQICRRVLDAIRSPTQATDARGGETSRQDLQRLAELTDQTGAPLPAADPRLDTGAVEIDAPFYVQLTDRARSVFEEVRQAFIAYHKENTPRFQAPPAPASRDS